MNLLHLLLVPLVILVAHVVVLLHDERPIVSSSEHVGYIERVISGAYRRWLDFIVTY
jgi:hypothetical protein